MSDQSIVTQGNYMSYREGSRVAGFALPDDRQLFLAAPDLLEALKALLDEESAKGGEAGDWDWTRFSEADPTGNWHAAKQAIDKATGQEQDRTACCPECEGRNINFDQMRCRDCDPDPDPEEGS